MLVRDAELEHGDGGDGGGAFSACPRVLTFILILPAIASDSEALSAA